ncbi:hypothetical protein B0H19DRAFT_1094597 [Mycena capillaripes]|nr:hypothetical protein B0H19DRAFT_1094597 [Mycena capillaripes]
MNASQSKGILGVQSEPHIRSGLARAGYPSSRGPALELGNARNDGREDRAIHREYLTKSADEIFSLGGSPSLPASDTTTNDVGPSYPRV